MVFTNVCLEVAFLCGAVRTVATSKRFFSGVGSEVVHKIGWGYGEIAAVGALKFLDVTSPRSDVTLCLLFNPTCTLGATTHHRRPPPAVLLLEVHHHSLLKDAQLSKYVKIQPNLPTQILKHVYTHNTPHKANPTIPNLKMSMAKITIVN